MLPLVYARGSVLVTEVVMWLWVDDVRKPPSDEWVWVKTVRDAMGILRHNTVEKVSLDHDLGEDATTRPIVLWMCETERWPRTVLVHSANPPGVEWLEGMVKHYHPANSV
jgi:hypothetical protein